MKKMRLILASTLIIIALVLTACSSGPTRPAIEVSYDDFLEVQDTISRLVSKEIEVAAGSSFTVILWSNATTGFQWSELATIGNQNIVEQIDHEYVAPSSDDDTPPAPGTAGKEVWTFKALQKGTTDIHMEYSQPWEGGEKDAYTFFLTVVVK